VKKLFRENPMITVSVALPLLVALFFILASVLPGLWSTPPEHDLLVSLQGRTTAKPSRVRIKLVVQDEQLTAVAVKSENPGYDNNPRLFRYSHSSGEVTEISIPIPENIENSADGQIISIPSVEGLRVSDAIQAPDGYEFRGRRTGGGLMTELFGGSRNRTDVSIAKNGVIIRVRLPTSDYWYNNVRFVGWVID
jgi:hypothetical protein